MIKAHKIRLNPNPEQELYFRKASDVARFVFNWGLEHWNKAYQNGEQPSAYALKAEFNSFKREAFSFVVKVTKCAAEGAFIYLAKAFKNFFRAKKEGREVGYPKFKSKKRSKPSFYLANDKLMFRDHEVYIPKLGWVNMAENLRVEGKILDAVASQTAGHWFVSVQVELEPHLQVIAIEDSNVKGMAQQRSLACSVADAAFGEIARQLEYKSRWFGSILQKVDRFFPSSKTCSVCGAINQSLTLADREWRYAGCGVCHKRDVNAAVNLKLEAERLLAGSGYIGVTPVDVVALA